MITVNPISIDCPTNDFAAYIDGELSPGQAGAVERHLAGCSPCRIDLNSQKEFLCSLDASLKREGQIELPADFARKIVVNAETSVDGLRRPIERYNAVFMSLGLALFVLFALGSDAIRFFDTAGMIAHQAATVGGIFGRVVYSVFIGLTIIVRSLGSQVRPDLFLAMSAAVGSLVVLIYARRRHPRVNRAQ